MARENGDVPIIKPVRYDAQVDRPSSRVTEGHEGRRATPIPPDQPPGLTPRATGGMQTLQPPADQTSATPAAPLTTRLRPRIILPSSRAAPRWLRHRPCREMIDVLLVHDDVERCSAIRSAVKANPELNLISETQTGREGLFAAATMLTGHPRILIVRLNLGDMTGFDFIAQVRQKAPDVYIIPALEGTEGGQVWQNLLQLELRDVLVGPIPPRKSPRCLPPPRRAPRNASRRPARPPTLKVKRLSFRSFRPAAASASRSWRRTSPRRSPSSATASRCSISASIPAISP